MHTCSGPWRLSASDHHPTATPSPAADKLEWQAPLGVIKYPDPRLRAPNARIALFDERLKQLADQMFEVMYQ
jgi:hypothetical protein